MTDYFVPCPDRARALRAAMEDALWSSAREVLVGRIATDRPRSTPLSAFLLDFGAYFDLTLVPPQLAEVPPAARKGAASHLISRLSDNADEAPPASGMPRIRNFSTDDFGSVEIERMRRWWDIEPANHMAIGPAAAAGIERSRALIATALGHLHAALPALHDETLAIVHDIVLSHPDGSQLIAYGGASSFALWGGVLLNTASNSDWMRLYKKIVHEAAHNLLFAIARNEPLVEDDPAERHASPLRADLRPMDGIFHAAFVSAREALACDALLCLHERQPRMDATEAAAIADLLEQAVLTFEDCTVQLRSHARLTPLGAAVLGDCEAYVSANFAVEPA